MNDVVAELDRWLADWSGKTGGAVWMDNNIVQRARDEIIALRDRVDRTQEHYGSALRLANERCAWLGKQVEEIINSDDIVSTAVEIANADNRS